MGKQKPRSSQMKTAFKLHQYVSWWIIKIR